MSLRESLRRATGASELHVAHPSTRNTQLHPSIDATAGATRAQRTATSPRDATATNTATVVQLAPRDRATKGDELHVASTRACNTQPSALTAPRVAQALVAAINRACNLRGDDDANRAGLIAECHALSLEQQIDMLEHFRAEAARWAKATGQA